MKTKPTWLAKAVRAAMGTKKPVVVTHVRSGSQKAANPHVEFDDELGDRRVDQAIGIKGPDPVLVFRKWACLCLMPVNLYFMIATTAIMFSPMFGPSPYPGGIWWTSFYMVAIVTLGFLFRVQYFYGWPRIFRYGVQKKSRYGL